MGNFFGKGKNNTIPTHSDMVLKPLPLSLEEVEVLKPQSTKCLYTKIDSDGKQCCNPCECIQCTPSSMFNKKIIKPSKPSEPKPLTKQKRNTCTCIESMYKNSPPMSSRCTCTTCSPISDNQFRFVFNPTERTKLKQDFLTTGTRGLFTRNNSGDLDFTSPTKPDAPADQPDDKDKYIAEQQKYEAQKKIYYDQIEILSRLTIICITFSYPPHQNWFLNALKGPTVSIAKSNFNKANSCFWSNKVVSGVINKNV